MDTSVVTTIMISVITAFIWAWTTFLWMKFEVNRLKDEVNDIKDRLHSLESIVNTLLTSQAIFKEKFDSIEKAIEKFELSISAFMTKVETSITNLTDKLILRWK